MSRPKKRCLVGGLPPALLYTPHGVPLADLRGVSVSPEECEALRLVDALGVSRREAAGRMGVSCPTLCRILARARNALARAISNGWAIRVDAENDAPGSKPCVSASDACGAAPADARDDSAPG